MTERLLKNIQEKQTLGFLANTQLFEFERLHHLNLRLIGCQWYANPTKKELGALFYEEKKHVFSVFYTWKLDEYF